MFFVERSECLLNATMCTQDQLDLIDRMMTNKMNSFSFVVFATEIAMDFEDYEQPMKSRTKIIQARNARIVPGVNYNSTLSYKIELTPNSVMTADNPY